MEDDENYQPFVITIVDDFFLRVWTNFGAENNLIFVDSTASLEVFNLPSFIFSIKTPFGAMPVAIAIVADETVETLESAFNRIRDSGLKFKLFMTDDAFSLKTALNRVWPEARLLLCNWHFQQAYWTWLLDGKHKVKADDRQYIYNCVASMVYAETEKVVNDMYEKIMHENGENKKLLDKVTKDYNRRDQWSNAFRGNN